MVPRIYPIAKETEFNKIIIPVKMGCHYNYFRMMSSVKRKTRALI